MFPILLASCLFAFVVTYFIVKKFIVFFENIGLVGYDINKKERPVVAEMGGVPVAFGFMIAVLIFVGFEIFVYNNAQYNMLFPSLLTVLLIVFIYMLDDLTAILRTKEVKKDFIKKQGFRQRHKLLFPLVAAIPIMSANVGTSTMVLPLFGEVNLGILYALVIIPLGILGASNATNMLAGMNGLEAGCGIISIFSISVFAYMQSEIVAASFGFIFCACLLAFLVYNWYPARIFPGDSMTYMTGTIIALVAIIGNVEKFALFIFPIWFAELALKLMSKFKAESFGKLNAKGYLIRPYKRIYSVTHIFMDGKTSERMIVAKIMLVQAIICVVAFLMVNVV
ncbi:MAG: hypothetical protein KAR87_03010 [Candidatus Aenigmarchaeota archaeon]|nr:hypothetical protein [Candidatus Aenigmarchaeota archaeon]